MTNPVTKTSHRKPFWERIERSIKPKAASCKASRSAAERSVEVRFEQSYRSDTLEDLVPKALELVFEDGAWKIASEQSR